MEKTNKPINLHAVSVLKPTPVDLQPQCERGWVRSEAESEKLFPPGGVRGKCGEVGENQEAREFFFGDEDKCRKGLSVLKGFSGCSLIS